MRKANKQKEDILSLEELNRLLDYNPETGVFTWKFVNSNRVKVGQQAGTLSKTHGYYVIAVNRKTYQAHRLAWFISTGQHPKDEIDHINGVRSDNRLINLREATSRENLLNKGVRCDNLSGVTGVYWEEVNQKWRARIHNPRGKSECLGRFKTKEEAVTARKVKEEEYFGEFQRKGNNMTTTVRVDVHCGHDTEVVIWMGDTDSNQEEEITMQNGESKQFYVYGNHAIMVNEQLKKIKGE